MDYATVYRQMLKDSNANFFCHTSHRALAKKLDITKRETIEAVNWLILKGKITFIEAIEKVGDGDYVTKYRMEDWGFD
jgi:hypothetical protein